MSQLKEECGVFGIFDNKDAAALTALGLHALQHRGQEGCGIVSYDGKNYHSEKRFGLVGDNFNKEKVLKKLPGNYYKKLSILMQCPNKQANKIKNELKDLGIEYELNNFFYNIFKILDSSDFVVARSGAGTINDIIQSQIPSILIPLPHSIYNHQYINAKYLTDKKAAQLVEEKDLGSDSAYFAFKKLFDNVDQRISIIKNLQQIKILDANKLMLNKVFK